MTAILKWTKRKLARSLSLGSEESDRCPNVRENVRAFHRDKKTVYNKRVSVKWGYTVISALNEAFFVVFPHLKSRNPEECAFWRYFFIVSLTSHFYVLAHAQHQMKFSFNLFVLNCDFAGMRS